MHCMPQLHADYGARSARHPSVTMLHLACTGAPVRSAHYPVLLFASALNTFRVPQDC